jgi:hypothetical protein
MIGQVRTCYALSGYIRPVDVRIVHVMSSSFRIGHDRLGYVRFCQIMPGWTC